MFNAICTVTRFPRVKPFINGDSTHSVKGRRGRDRIVVGFIATYVISAYHPYRCEVESRSGEVYWIQRYVIKFVSDLRQVGSFLRVLWFPPPITLTATI